MKIIIDIDKKEVTLIGNITCKDVDKYIPTGKEIEDFIVKIEQKEKEESKNKIITVPLVGGVSSPDFTSIC